MVQEMTAQETCGLRNIIKKLKSVSGRRYQPQPLATKDIEWLLQKVGALFKKQPMLLEIEPPVNICGDIHGQYTDLLRLFRHGGMPDTNRYLFLGDYVDRGTQNLEVICLLFAYKITYPDGFFILRGNHESRNINRVYGFHEEVCRRYSYGLWEQFNDVFDWMPLAALVKDRIFCMHGGISPELHSFDQIRNVHRPTEVPEEGLVADLLWADPDKSVQGFKPSTRGISYRFGADAVIEFCNRMGIDMIARAHQVVIEGYEFFADDHLITLFSAPDYCNQFNNSGGILLVSDKLTCKIKQLPSKSIA